MINTKTEHTHYIKSSSSSTNYAQIRFKGEDLRTKMKIPGLSSLQQRVLSLNDDDTDNSFKSLTELSDDTVTLSKPITKSHSFKATKNLPFDAEPCDVKSLTKVFIEKEQKHRAPITKASSLDSVKNLDDHIHTSEMEVELRKSMLNVDSSDIEKSVKTDSNNEQKDVNVESGVFPDSAITISGPSHTAIVNVTSNKEDCTNTSNKSFTCETAEVITNNNTVNIKEHQVSVTKIHVKRELTHVTQSTLTTSHSTIPEFLNKSLNKVEARPVSNVILSMKSPKILEEPVERPKTLFDFEIPLDVSSKPPAPRKFSKENLEIIEKIQKEEEVLSKSTPFVTSTSVNRFTKNDVRNSSRKSSIISIGPDLSSSKKTALSTSRSASLDSLKSEVVESDKSSQDSLDVPNVTSKEKDPPSGDVVVLRRKSLANKKTEEEPELMKVFARRSLKLKDSELDAIQDNLMGQIKTRDSDKENQIDSPVEDRRKSFNKSQDGDNEIMPKRKSTVKELAKEEPTDTKFHVKEILVENKSSEISKNSNKDSSGSPPVLRKTFNNNIFLGQRALSLNPSKIVSSDLIVKKQTSVADRRKTEQWITNSEEKQIKEKIIEDILPQTNLITEPKNFSQRKAEWEMRAQQAARKKNTP